MRAEPDVRARLDATPQQIEVVRHAMLGAVQDAGGTARPAAVKGLSVAGKTGTAQYKVAGRNYRRIARGLSGSHPMINHRSQSPC